MANKISDLQKKLSQSDTGKADIRGKEYSTVPLRVELFRRELDAGDITNLTSIFTRVEMYEDRVVTRAYLAEEVDVIINEEGQEIVQMKNVKSVGTSEEDRQASMINKTSAVENSETSAVGRMLAVLGVHGGVMASAEEVDSAMKAQKVVELRPSKKQTTNMTVEEFLKVLVKSKTKDDVNSLLISEKVFFDKLKSESEMDFLELKKQVTDYRDALPNKAENKENLNG